MDIIVVLFIIYAHLLANLFPNACCHHLQLLLKPICIFSASGLDTDTAQADTENYELETVEFLLKVEETVIEE